MYRRHPVTWLQVFPFLETIFFLWEKLKEGRFIWET